MDKNKINCKYFAKSENQIWLMEFKGDLCFCVSCLGQVKNEVSHKTKKRNPTNTIGYNRNKKNTQRNGKRIGG